MVLSKEAIFKILTENPAKIVKSEANLGNLRKELRQFLYYLLKIYSSKDAVLQENWVAVVKLREK